MTGPQPCGEGYARQPKRNPWFPRSSKNLSRPVTALVTTPTSQNPRVYWFVTTSRPPGPCGPRSHNSAFAQGGGPSHCRHLETTTGPERGHPCPQQASGAGATGEFREPDERSNVAADRDVNRCQFKPKLLIRIAGFRPKPTDPAIQKSFPTLKLPLN